MAATLLIACIGNSQRPCLFLRAQHHTSLFVLYSSMRCCQLQSLKTPQLCMQPRLKVQVAHAKCRMGCVQRCSRAARETA